MNTWIRTILDSPTSTRRALKEAVLNGLKKYNAKYKRKKGLGLSPEEWSEVAYQMAKNGEMSLEDYFAGPTPSEITSYDPTVLQFYKDLKAERKFEYVGLVPWIDYMMEHGSKAKLEALWNHELGSAGLIYKIKGLPAFVVLNPDMDLHDATVNKIPGNSKREMRGISG